MEMTPLSRTIGTDQLVDEMVVRFTHTVGQRGASAAERYNRIDAARLEKKPQPGIEHSTACRRQEVLALTRNGSVRPGQPALC
jgi:hypothetical protein